MSQSGGGIAVGVLASFTFVWRLKFFFEPKHGINRLPNCSWFDDPTRCLLDGHIVGGTVQAGLLLAAGTIPWLLHSLSTPVLSVETIKSIRILPYSTGCLKLLFLLILAPRMASCTDCPSSIYEQVVNSDGALEFPLFHREHPCVQQHQRPSGGIDEMKLPIDLVRDGKINWDIYLMPIKLGTPPVWNLVAIDTGSTLSFVQCEPCTVHCHEQSRAGQIFDPSKSTTFRRVGCSSPYCQAVHGRLRLQSKACMEIEDSCLYTMSYGKRYAYSVGKLVTDKLTVGQNDALSVSNFYFGCSLDTEYDQYEAGIFGFGGDPFSFFAQVSRLVDYKAFSYCFPSDKKKTGYLSIGKYNDVSSASYTPLLIEALRSLYSLKLDKLVANGITLVTYPSEMIVDSGSQWTFLLSATFDQLDKVITKAVEPLGYMRSRNPNPGLDHICFEDKFFTTFSNWSALPSVELSFAMGATLKVPPKSAFYNHGNFGLCMYFIRDASIAKGMQILGHTATQSVGVTFDIQGSKFVFRNGDC